MATLNITHETLPANASPAASEGFIGKAEVARRIKKSVRSVDNWMAAGYLPYYRIGRSILFKWSEIEAALAQNCRISQG